jgi:hypothetical protein
LGAMRPDRERSLVDQGARVVALEV